MHLAYKSPYPRMTGLEVTICGDRSVETDGDTRYDHRLLASTPLPSETARSRAAGAQPALAPVLVIAATLTGWQNRRSSPPFLFAERLLVRRSVVACPRQ
jgi:hypothetical protein